MARKIRMSRVHETLQDLRDGRIDRNERLSECIDQYSTPQDMRDAHLSAAMGTWHLLVAPQIFTPRCVDMDNLEDQPFLCLRDNHLRNYSLRVRPEYTTIKYRGHELNHKYDLMHSNQDRHDLLAFLVQQWQRHENTKIQRERKTALMERHDRDKENYRVPNTDSAACMIMKNHRSKRLTQRVRTCARPSPLSNTPAKAVEQGECDKG